VDQDVKERGAANEALAHMFVEGDGRSGSGDRRHPAILMHAISVAAMRLYEGYGFVASPVDPIKVMITIAEAAKIL
jgi:hypothetical protein